MAKPRKPGGPKQKLSPRARAAKIKRDEKTAMTPRRTKIKAENQRKRRAAIKKGENVKNKDYDHTLGRFVSVKRNRSATKTTNNTMPTKKKPGLKGTRAGRATLKAVKATRKPAASKGGTIKKAGAKSPVKRKPRVSALDKKSPMKKLSNSGKPTGVKKAGTTKSTIKGVGGKSPMKSKFSKLSAKIQKSGKSKKSADAITAAIGRKKYGAAGMAKKAAAGRRKK